MIMYRILCMVCSLCGVVSSRCRGGARGISSNSESFKAERRGSLGVAGIATRRVARADSERPVFGNCEVSSGAFAPRPWQGLRLAVIDEPLNRSAETDLIRAISAEFLDKSGFPPVIKRQLIRRHVAVPGVVSHLNKQSSCHNAE